MTKIFQCSGDDIFGGTITDFSSTGIRDRSTKPTLIVEDDKITVKFAAIEAIENDLILRGDLKVAGTINAESVRCLEIVANQRYEKQYLEFQGADKESIGAGLLWRGARTRQFVLRSDPERFCSTENIDVAEDRSYLINGVAALSKDQLGSAVVKSSIQTLGTLTELNVQGNVNINDRIFFSPLRAGLGVGIAEGHGLVSIFDAANNVEIIIDSSANGAGKIGTYGAKGLELVTNNQTRIGISETGSVTVNGDLALRGNLKVAGTINAEFIRCLEIITNQRYEKQYLEFQGIDNESVGAGLLWRGSRTKQFVLRSDPERFFSTENIDLADDRSFLINGVSTLSKDRLGNDVVHSNLRTLGSLTNLTVRGELNINDYIFCNPSSNRLGIGTDTANGLVSIFDAANNVEIIIDGTANGTGKIGTYSTKGLELVTDNQTRVTISEIGNITIGHENKDSTITRVYGKLAVGVKNPTEQFEVAGNIKMGNRLFANASGAPGVGSYQKGDIFWNSDPKPGTHVGWICISGGSPGNWKPFGAIET